MLSFAADGLFDCFATSSECNYATSSTTYTDDGTQCCEAGGLSTLDVGVPLGQSMCLQCDGKKNLNPFPRPSSTLPHVMVS